MTELKDRWKNYRPNKKRSLGRPSQQWNETQYLSGLTIRDNETKARKIIAILDIFLIIKVLTKVQEFPHPRNLINHLEMSERLSKAISYRYQSVFSCHGECTLLLKVSTYYRNTFFFKQYS